jgi:replicative DNA helicase
MIDKNTLQNERNLIYLLLHSKDAIDKFYDFGLTADNFSDTHKYIVTLITEAYDSYGILLTRKSFKEKLKLYNIPKERIAHEVAFNSCYAARSDSNDLPMIANKIIHSNVEISITKTFGEYKKNKPADGNLVALKKMVDSFQDIIDGATVSKGEGYFGDIRELTKERIKYIEDVRDGKIVEDPLILSGIREIDYTMVNGFEKGTLTLICADVGGYKSAMMLNIGLNVWKSGYNVLFVPLEMTRDQMWRRACSREARVRSEFITRNIKNITAEQMGKIRAMEEAWNSYQSKFFIMEEPGNTTVFKIQREIEKHIEIFKPKLVVIDYVANLEAHKERYGRNDLEIGDMLKTMRQMGKDLDFAVLSAAQLGRTALNRIRKSGSNRDKASINSEDIRGSHEYAADADNIFAQLKSASQPNELLDIFCVKSRHGPTIFENESTRATLDVHPEYGLICSSSYGNPVGEDGEDGEDGGVYSYDEDLGDLMDKAEEDKVVDAGSDFNEEDNMYNHTFYNSVTDDNSDIEASITDGDAKEDEFEDW